MRKGKKTTRCLKMFFFFKLEQHPFYLKTISSKKKSCFSAHIKNLV